MQQNPRRFLHLYSKYAEMCKKEGLPIKEPKEWLISLLEANSWGMKVTSARNHISQNCLRLTMLHYGIKKVKPGTKIVRHWLALGLNPKEELIKIIRKYGYYHKVADRLIPSSTSLVNAGKELGVYVGNDGYILLRGKERLYTAEEIIKMKGLNRRKIQNISQQGNIPFDKILQGMVPEIERINISLLGYPLEEAMKLLPLPILKRRSDWRKWI